MNAANLTDLWFGLLAYCTDPKFDSKMFAMKSKNISDWYKKMDYQEQGEFTALIAERLPGWQSTP